MKIIFITLFISFIQSGSSSLMSRIGLTLGKRPAHLNQIDHTRRVPWVVKEMLAEEKRKEDELPFIKRKALKRTGPPPCVGICYTQKLEALKAREELTRHNEVLKEECESDDCIDYKAFGDSIPVQLTSKPSAKQTVQSPQPSSQSHQNSDDSSQHDEDSQADNNNNDEADQLDTQHNDEKDIIESNQAKPIDDNTDNADNVADFSNNVDTSAIDDLEDDIKDSEEEDNEEEYTDDTEQSRR